MTKKEIAALRNGLYIIFWKPEYGGGFSLAAVGICSDGKRWFAPTNWVNSGAIMEDHKRMILKVTLILSK